RLPPAPPTFSMKNCWPSFSDSRCAMSRPAISVTPPAGNGMMILTGLLGYCSAVAAPGAASTAMQDRPSRTARRTAAKTVMTLPPGDLIFCYWRDGADPSLRDNCAECKRHIVAATNDARRQCAEDRSVRRQLLVGPRGDQGARALVRNLAGQSSPGAD